MYIALFFDREQTRSFLPARLTRLPADFHVSAVLTRTPVTVESAPRGLKKIRVLKRRNAKPFKNTRAHAARRDQPQNAPVAWIMEPRRKSSAARRKERHAGCGGRAWRGTPQPTRRRELRADRLPVSIAHTCACRRGDAALDLDDSEARHAANADAAPANDQLHHAVSRRQAAARQPRTVTSHLQPAAGEEIFHRVVEEAKTLQEYGHERRPGDAQTRLVRQQTMAVLVPAR